MNPLVLLDLLKNKYLWGAVVTLGLIWWAHDWVTDYGDRRGAHDAKVVQDKWDADKARIEREALTKATENLVKEDAARRNNEELHNAAQKDLDDARARGDLSARRVLDLEARIAANRGAVQKDPGGPATLPPGEDGSDGTLRRLLGDALTECRQNAIDQTASYNSIAPQL